MNNDSKKFLIIVIDIIAAIVLISLFIIAMTHDNPNKKIEKPADSDQSVSSASADAVQDEEAVIENEDTSIHETASTNTVSEDSVSDDSISENSLSENEVAAIYSYDLPGAPQVMNSPSGTVLSLSGIDTANLGNYFVIYDIPEDIFEYINGKSYQENTEITIADLKYIKVLHYNFEHNVQVGELIVNASVANEIRDIFLALFCNGYEIQSMYLPDRYWTGDGNTTDSASCDANNTSAFFYRTVDGSTKLSNHAYGKAIDINPQQNPYVGYSTGVPVCEHENALPYIDRASGLPHMITESDICYQLFSSYGYGWGGAWNSIKDYQHFEKN